MARVMGKHHGTSVYQFLVPVPSISLEIEHATDYMYQVYIPTENSSNKYTPKVKTLQLLHFSPDHHQASRASSHDHRTPHIKISDQFAT